MTPSTRSLLDERNVGSFDVFMGFDPGLHWPCFPHPSPSETIAHDQAENEPTGSGRAFQRAADFRLSDTRIIAHRDFNHAVSIQRAFQDHLNRPAIGSLFERERT